jgi:sialic acid synthase SpsE
MKLELTEPLVIAEIGINHDGDFAKANRMVIAAYTSGCKCVKFQCHVIEDEYIGIAKNVIPPNAKESIYAIMERCAFSEEQDRSLKETTEKLGMKYLSTPFSRAAADRLERMGVEWYKIGSGECNNYPLIQHIASFGKPVILSTGMNSIDTIRPAVSALYNAPLAVLHCTSEYPTDYSHVRLGALEDLRDAFPDVTIGLSDHSLGIYTSLGAVALGAMVIEKHFTLDRQWPGPDNKISILPSELTQLMHGVSAVYQALGGHKDVLDGEMATSKFAYACVVSTNSIMKGEKLHSGNTWVKRPGTGEIPASKFGTVIGKTALEDIPPDTQIEWGMLE